MDSGSAYTLTTNYNALSRPASVVYPTGLTINTRYTAYGQLAQLTSGSTGARYWQVNAVNARGNVTTGSLGNSVSETRVYDPTIGI
jgi:hypothetical protein